MYLLSAAALSLLPLALASPILSARTCPTPSDFFITGFTTFTPAANNPTGSASIFFRLSDSATNVSTSCQRQLPPGSGRTVADPDHYYGCDNPAVKYLYDGTVLGIKETFNCDGNIKTASGNSTLSQFCFPIQPPFPGGFGTECETPTGADNVFVTKVE